MCLQYGNVEQRSTFGTQQPAKEVSKFHFNIQTRSFSFLFWQVFPYCLTKTMTYLFSHSSCALRALVVWITEWWVPMAMCCLSKTRSLSARIYGLSMTSRKCAMCVSLSAKTRYPCSVLKLYCVLEAGTWGVVPLCICKITVKRQYTLNYKHSTQKTNKPLSTWLAAGICYTGPSHYCANRSKR